MGDIYILGIESSCDDTSAAVLKNGILLSNVTASQAVHEAYGGVVPELASRAHQQNVVPVVDQAIKKAGITKETAIRKLSEKIGVSLENITAFGDDLADIGSLKMCGTGVAMGNALDVVKEAADITIGSNDEDGIAEYLEGLVRD